MADQPAFQSLVFWFTRVQLIDSGRATPERASAEPRTLYVGRSPRNNKHAQFNDHQMTVEQVQVEHDIERIIRSLGLQKQFEQWYLETIENRDPFYPCRGLLTRYAQDFFKDSQYILLIEDEGIEIQSLFLGDFNG